MKTIEERAREWAEEQLQDHRDYATMSDKVKKVWRENYINDYCHIATEQKAIDEKEMFAEREKAFNNGYEVAKKELIEKALEWLKMYDITFTQTPSMLEDFKKAMEEI